MSESYIFHVGDQCFVHLPIPQSYIEHENEKIGSKGIKKVAILVLDRSGSMFNDYDQARQALLETIDSLEEAHVTDIGAVIFESRSVTKSSLDCSKLWELKQWVRQQHVGGGTNIPRALNEVRMHMNRFSTSYPESPIQFSVVFFTDGEDNSGQVIMECVATTKMNRLINGSNGRLNLAMHCIGFTPDHDATLLGQLTKLGTLEGTFQYVQSASDIRQALDVVLGFSGHVVPLKIITGSNREVLVRGSDSVIIEVAEYESIQPFILQLVGSDLSLSVVPKMEPEEISEEYVRGVIRVAESSLREILARCTGSEYKLDVSDDGQIQSIHQSLLAVMAKVFKRSQSSSREVRRKLLSALQQACALAHELGSILARIRRDGIITNDVIASWQASSYRSTVMKARDCRTLDKRFEKNVAKLEELEEQIQELTNSLDAAQLEDEIPGDLLDSTICMLSRANMIEALQEGDCICLCLDIRRSSAAIHDPSLLTIRRAGPSFISAQSFMDILADQISEPTETFERWDAHDKPATVHGGFDRQQSYAKVFPGLANEPVTAILPLYLNKKHWDIAFKRSKAILSWVATLDVAGGSGTEPVVIPFLVLFQLIKQFTREPTDNNRFLFKLVLETCMAIYQTTPFGLPQKISEQFNNFMTSPANRTIDVVPSIPVFLGQLLCAVVNGDITLTANQISQLGPLVSEEHFRRVLETLDSTGFPNPNDINSFLGLDRDRFYTKPVREWKARQEVIMHGHITQQIDVAAFGQAFVDGLKFGPMVSASLGNVEVEFPDPVWDDISKAAHDPFLQKISSFAHQDLCTISTLVDIIEKKGCLKDTIRGSSECIFDRMTPICRLAFCIQSFMQSKNSLRRAAISNGTFVPGTYNNEQAAWQFIRSTIRANLQKEAGKTVSNLARIVNVSVDRAMAKIFKETKDLNVAAGILRLYCKFRGSSRFPTFIPVLQLTEPVGNRPDSPSDLAKLKMLVTGLHEGRPVFADELLLECPLEDRSLPTRQHWRPTRANVHRFLNFFVGMPSATEEILCELFPTFATYIKPRFHPSSSC